MATESKGGDGGAQGAWEGLEEAGLRSETDVSEHFSEPVRAEKCRAMLDLMWAIRLDDAEGARAADARLSKAGVSDEERQSAAYLTIPEMGHAGGELSGWLLRSEWFGARERAIKNGKAGWAKSASEELGAQMAMAGNAAGLDEMVKAGAMTVARAFESALSHRNEKLTERYGARLLASGKAPPAFAVAALCKMAPSLYQRGFAASEYPLDRYFKAWGSLISQEQRGQMWGDAICYANARLAACLGRCGLEPKDWILSGCSLHLSGGEPARVENPTALEYALQQRRHWRSGDAFLGALLGIEAISKQRSKVHPYALMDASNGDLEAFAKMGIRVDGVDARGRNLLHLALSRPHYSRAALSFFVANAKRFPELWDKEDDRGKTPLSLLKADEIKKVEQALSAGEKTALSRELAGRRGAKAKRRPGL